MGVKFKKKKSGVPVSLMSRVGYQLDLSSQFRGKKTKQQPQEEATKH